MYLFIFEDGSIKKGSIVEDGDTAAADDGILDIIDISGAEPLQYHDGEWHEIEDV